MVHILSDKAIQKGTSTAPRVRLKHPLTQDRRTSERFLRAPPAHSTGEPLNQSLGNAQTIRLLTCNYLAIHTLHTYISYLILDQYFYSVDSRGRFRLRSRISLLVQNVLPSGVTVEEEPLISGEDPIMGFARWSLACVKVPFAARTARFLRRGSRRGASRAVVLLFCRGKHTLVHCKAALLSLESRPLQLPPEQLRAQPLQPQLLLLPKLMPVLLYLLRPGLLLI
jgi:hypothetical protein